MEHAAPSSVEVDLKNRTAKITGNDIITILCLLLVVAVSVVLWMHHEDAKIGRAEFVAVLKEQVATSKESIATQKEQNCLFVHRQRFKPEEYQTLADFCKTR